MRKKTRGMDLHILHNYSFDDLVKTGIYKISIKDQYKIYVGSTRLGLLVEE